MPYKPKKPCAHHGCRELTANRYCEAHAKQDAKNFRTHESGKRYGTQWRKIRARYIADNPLCEMCKDDGRLTPADTVHHKRRIADGGTNESENLQALCSSCHSRLHAKDGERWNRG